MAAQDPTEGVRDYETALAKIGTLIFSRKRVDGTSWGDDFNSMSTCVQHLDMEEDLRKLSIIHVAGTKGKGSTCAFAESILREAGCSTGLFTSPHLVDIRERFRINGEPVAKEIFVLRFWEVWDRLQAKVTPEFPMPTYFRFLTLLGLHIFIQQKVQAVVLEVGLGGRWDATNVVPAPKVCGVSSLGYDHMELLGHTLREIAGEKAGIFKAGVPAFTSPQEEEAMLSLQARADQLQIPLEVVTPITEYSTDPASGLQTVELGLAGEHQKLNAALAVKLCRVWAQREPSAPEAMKRAEGAIAEYKVLPALYLQGLKKCRWPGRAQVLPDVGEGGSGGRLTFYLDGAHTDDSVQSCATWFVEATRRADEADSLAAAPAQRYLFFNCMEVTPARVCDWWVDVVFGTSNDKLVFLLEPSSRFCGRCA